MKQAPPAQWMAVWENTAGKIKKKSVNTKSPPWHTKVFPSGCEKYKFCRGVDFWLRSGGGFDRDPIFVSGSCSGSRATRQQPLFELIHVWLKRQNIPQNKQMMRWSKLANISRICWPDGGKIKTAHVSNEGSQPHCMSVQCLGSPLVMIMWSWEKARLGETCNYLIKSG